jgi:hypothetical protein
MRSHFLLCIALLVGLQILAAQDVRKPNFGNLDFQSSAQHHSRFSTLGEHFLHKA